MTTVLTAQRQKEAQASRSSATLFHEPARQPKETVFNRREIKYLVSYEKADALVRTLGKDLVTDKRGTTVIRNLYVDTPDYRLIRRSIEKPHYKEKLRVRTYGTVAESEHEAFFEVKKKLGGRVYKRRMALPLSQAPDCIQGGGVCTTQIARELAWSVASYSPLCGVMSVVYERCAYTYREAGAAARITIDCNIVAKKGSWDDFRLPVQAPAWQQLLAREHCVMEIKVPDAVPLALTQVLSKLEIYPTSFSKVGTAYARIIL